MGKHEIFTVSTFLKTMSILTKSAIRAEIQKGNIKIEPFYLNQLGPNGYDLHLGRRLFMMRSVTLLDTKEDASGYYEEIRLRRFKNGEAWLLYPGCVYLGVSLEYTETHKHVPIMEGKSSLGRTGIESHICAGFGDVGFCGYWTLEIRVAYPTLMYPGMPIGQIVFHTVEGETETTYQQTGSYNNTEAVPGIPNLWKKEHQFIQI